MVNFLDQHDGSLRERWPWCGADFSLALIAVAASGDAGKLTINSLLVNLFDNNKYYRRCWRGENARIAAVSTTLTMPAGKTG
ncbi:MULTISPECIES: hypothetical protein [Vogesella]|jgi:hypothetical protein|uniref:hypothetical protein n=1 Tax=Vogesella TaxID=57739 RepID=UPI0011C439A6|nr:MULTISPECIES: hypothetical protein [Vogesella]MCQ4144566.1 hypothetical protein [Vogesella sp. AC12]